MTNKFEQLLELLINEEQDKAEALFHEIVVEKSRDIYEGLADADTQTEAKHKDEKDEKKDMKEDEVSETSEESKDEEVKETSDESSVFLLNVDSINSKLPLSTPLLILKVACKLSLVNAKISCSSSLSFTIYKTC